MLPSYARVIREGQEEKVLAEELVPGDLVLIEEGDRISADGRVNFCYRFSGQSICPNR